MSMPTFAEFKLDESTVVQRALAIAYEGDRPAAGVGASVGPANLPLFLYLLAPALRLWADPVAAVLLVAMLNVLAVAACYAVGRNFLSSKAALIAAYLFAVGGWAVYYGRKIWTQNLPLFTLVFVAALLLTFVRRRPWAFPVASLGLAALIGLHLGGLAFVPILGLGILCYPRVLKWPPFLLGGGLFVLALAPYVLEDALRGWTYMGGLLSYAGGNPEFSLDALRYAVMLSGNRGFEGLAGGLAPLYRAGLPSLWWLNSVLDLLLAGAVLYTLVEIFWAPLERRRTNFFLLLWLVVPVLLQLRPSSLTQPHYFILLYPVQFLLIGHFLTAARKRWMPPGRVMRMGAVMLGLFLSLWGIWQVLTLARLGSFMVEHPTTGGYGIPLHYRRAAARLAAEDLCPGPVVVLSEGNSPRFDEDPAVFEALFFGRERHFADANAFPLPESSSNAYLVGPVYDKATPLDARAEYLRTLPDIEDLGVLVMPKGPAYYAFCRQGAGRDGLLADFTRLPGDVPFANGVVFTAYRAPERVGPGETAVVELAWWLREGVSAEPATHFYVHLLDVEGTSVAQVDHDGGYPAHSWRGGDLVFSRFLLSVPAALPEGRYPVRVGLYTLSDVVRVPVVDPSGSPVDDGVTLTELEVAP